MKNRTFEGRPFESFINEANKSRAVPEAIDLLNQMLVYDKNLRITPKKAMEHHYFDPIRKFALEQEEKGEG